MYILHHICRKTFAILNILRADINDSDEVYERKASYERLTRVSDRCQVRRWLWWNGASLQVKLIDDVLSEWVELDNHQSKTCIGIDQKSIDLQPMKAWMSRRILRG